MVNTMNKFIRQLSHWGKLLSVAVLVMGAQAYAVETPKQLIPFQGSLRDETGSVISNNLYQLTFAIYNQQNGGIRCWEEVHQSVSVVNGYVNVLLGGITDISYAGFKAAGNECASDNIDMIDFSQGYYLGITIGKREGDSSSQVISTSNELLPRHRLVPSFFSQNSYQSHNSDMLDGKHADEFADALLLNNVMKDIYLNNGVDFLSSDGSVADGFGGFVANYAQDTHLTKVMKDIYRYDANSQSFLDVNGNPTTSVTDFSPRLDYALTDKRLLALLKLHYKYLFGNFVDANNVPTEDIDQFVLKKITSKDLGIETFDINWTESSVPELGVDGYAHVGSFKYKRTYTGTYEIRYSSSSATPISDYNLFFTVSGAGNNQVVIIPRGMDSSEITLTLKAPTPTGDYNQLSLIDIKVRVLAIKK